MRNLVIAAFALALAPGAAAVPIPKNGPDCSGPDHYAAGVSFATLKNAGLLTNETVVWSKVQSRTIASQLSRKNVWRQVFRVTFPLTNGKKLETIFVQDASNEECSFGDTQLFLIAKDLTNQ
jgi:hypothetical protein